MYYTLSAFCDDYSIANSGINVKFFISQKGKGSGSILGDFFIFDRIFAKNARIYAKNAVVTEKY